jgi:hypothetical protein
LNNNQERVYDWEPLIFACLLISVKTQEYSFHFNAKSFEYDDWHSINEMELAVARELLQEAETGGEILPMMLGKEVVLYYYYLDLIYGSPTVVRGAIYNQYFILNLISSLIYTDSELMLEPKFEIVKALLNLGFPLLDSPEKVTASERIKKKIVYLLKTRVNHVKWLDQDLLQFLGV